ncbi:MAG: hypothetical protein WCP29_03525 [Acidobacteriota bacterium]
MSRRALLKGAATAAAAAAAGAVGVGAQQKPGLMPDDGGVVPWRTPAGALSFLDKKEYISNMEIISFLPGATISAGEPLISMWAKGKQRLFPGGGGWIDVTDPRKPVAIKTPSRTGGAVAYNNKLKKWIMMTTAAAPLTNGTPEHPMGRYDPDIRKIYDDFKGLRGIRTYDVTDAVRPVLLQEFSTGAKGMGTHMNYYDGGQYAFLEAGWDETLRMENSQRAFSNALMIVDISDPASIKEVSRFWAPGQKYGEDAIYNTYPFADDHQSWTGNHGSMITPIRPEDGGRVGYSGFGAFGMFTLDLTDIRNPKVLSQFRWQYESPAGIPFHTIYPITAGPSHPKLQNLVLGIPETIQADCREPIKIPYVIDIKDPRNPRVIGLFPKPSAPKDAPYADFCLARGRFGTHNCQNWVAPGIARPEMFAVAWFAAGGRLFDLSDPTNPKEVAWYVPPAAASGDLTKYETWWRGTSECMTIEWDRNLIWLGTHSGTYCLSSPALGKPVLEPKKIDRWSVAHVNVGWDEATPTVSYLGRGLSQMG